MPVTGWTSLVLRVDDATDTQPISCSWTTTAGTIIGEGTEVTFLAPKDNCVAEVSATVVYEEGAEPVTVEIKREISVFKRVVMIKADDLIFPGNLRPGLDPRWERFLAFLGEREIAASMGIVGQSIVKASDHEIVRVQELDRSGLIEFWNHGYDHLRGHTPDGKWWAEFYKVPYEQQQEHLQLTQDLARTRLGLSLRVFGAPFNMIDETTQAVVENNPEIQGWFHAGGVKGIWAPPHDVEEDFTPSLAAVVQNLDKPSPDNRDYVVLQVHPCSWDDAQFQVFTEIIEYLLARGDVTFLRPSDFIDRLQYMRN